MKRLAVIADSESSPVGSSFSSRLRGKRDQNAVKHAPTGMR